LVLAGTLARYPRMRLLAAHCGGVFPMLLGRLDYAYEGLKRVAARMGKGGGPPGPGPPSGPPDAGGKLEVSLEGAVPSERAAGLYFDTASYHPAAIHAAIEAVGVDRVVLGTDYPPAGDSPDRAIQVVERLGLDQQDRDRILHENGRRLLDGESQEER
jgi:aminocarboxymuconate-semialdehyde decarboxylase